MSTDNILNNISFDMPKDKSNVIKVVGVGGGGSNAINYMFQQGITGVDFVICNTDAQALQNSGVPNKIQLGVSLTEGLGAGANPEIGEQAAEESISDLEAMLEVNTKMVFITAGMGGGTGTGAAPVIAKLAQELGILTVGIVTMPFQFEGRLRNQQAQKGIEKLREHVDSLVVINNNKLREVYGNLGFKSGFSKADEVLASASRGIAEVITKHYTQNIDLHDAKTVLRNSGTAIMGSAKAAGDNRAHDAIVAALDSPLLNDNKITGAKNVLLLIVSGTREITLDEIGEINDHIQQEAGNSADIIMGVGDDDDLEDAVSVTIIATGFGTDQQDEISNTETKKIVHKLDDDIDDLPFKSFKKTPPTPPTDNDEPPKKVIRHVLTDDEDVSPNFTKKNDVETNTKPKDSGSNTNPNAEDDFVINNTTEDVDASVNINTESSYTEDDQTSLTFDLPVSSPQPKATPETNEPRIVHNLEDYEDESFDTPKPKTDNVTKYVLEDINDVEFVPVKKTTTPKDDTPENPLDNIVLKTNDDNEDNETQAKTIVKQVDPPETTEPSVSELMKSRAAERRRTLKHFNHNFNPKKFTDLDNEPAYKRQGIELDETTHSSEDESTRATLSTDDNDDISLNKGNSFLYDNVD